MARARRSKTTPASLTAADERRIAAALSDAERALAAPVVLHLEERSDGPADGRAKMLWAFHGLHETDGVLIYVAQSSAEAALFASPGVQARVSRWRSIGEALVRDVSAGKLATGILGVLQRLAEVAG